MYVKIILITKILNEDFDKYAKILFVNMLISNHCRKMY